MSRLFITSDGSPSLISETFSESYHSHFGALSEAQTVYIQALTDHLSKDFNKPEIRVFEMGFGTGLNAFLSLLACHKLPQTLYYDAVEAFPLDPTTALSVLQPHALDTQTQQWMKLLIQGPWNQSFRLHEQAYIQKWAQSLLDHPIQTNHYDAIFFDAFSPNIQPELWSEAVFQTLFESLRTPGFLSTYCVKGDVKRALKKAGFRIEKRPGPPGKREILIAYKEAY